MKAIVVAMLLLFLQSLCGVHAQSRNEPEKFVSFQALLYADSLVNAFYSRNIAQYISLSYPGAVVYHGGKTGFERFLENAMSVQRPGAHPRTEMHQLVKENEKEWLCVIKKVSMEWIDGRSARVNNFIVGRSVDNGRSWTFVEPALTTYKLEHVMPDAYVGVPARKVEF